MQTTHSLPPLLQHLSSFVPIASGILLIAIYALIVGRSAERAGLSPRARWLAPIFVAAFFTVWFGIALMAADDANFPLARPELLQPLSGAVSLLPFLAALAVVFGSRTWRAINAAAAPEWLIAVQSYRAAGVLFLFPNLYYNILPAGFAWPAGVGDMITGILAPFVALAVARNRPGAHTWAVAWNIFGILDLVVAPAAAILSGAHVLELYPLSLVPLFLGPPLGILTHVISLRNLAAIRRAPSPREFPAGTSPVTL